MTLDIGPGQVAFQQESAEVREGIDVITVSDISAGKLNAAMNIRIFLTADQSSHGFGRPVFGLYLNRNQEICSSDEEVLLKGGVLTLVVVEFVSCFD